MARNVRLRIHLRKKGSYDKSAEFPFRPTYLSGFYFPIRGFSVSLFIHAAAVIGWFFLHVFQLPPAPERVTFIDLRVPEVMYLPPLQEKKPPKSTAGPKPRPKRATPAPANEGLSYPGLQPILSDVPHPTNRIQTVLHPDVPDLPTVEPPLPIPNVVQTKKQVPVVQELVEPEPVPPKPEPVPPKPEPVPPEPEPVPPEPEPVPPEPEPVPPEPEPVPPEPEPVLAEPIAPEIPNQEPVIEPEMVLPEMELAQLDRTRASDPVRLPVAKPLARPKASRSFPAIKIPNLVRISPKTPVPAPAAEVTENPVAAPKTVAKPKTPTAGFVPGVPEKDENLLALTPLPALPTRQAKIPKVEARGLFAVSPKPNLATSIVDPGIELNSALKDIRPLKIAPPVVPPKIDTTAKSEPQPKAKPDGAEGNDSQAAGTGANAKYGLREAPISNPGSDAFEGITVIGGTYETSGKPNIAAPARKEDDFGEISIIGGNYEPGKGKDAAAVTRAPRPLQTAYSLNIISTENSGGGLPSFGVFQNEQIYTAYLDMRKIETEQDPSWTLEFGVIRDPNAGIIIDFDSEPNHEGMILPFPSAKTRPNFPSELVRPHLGDMIVVYGIIDKAGDLKQLAIKKSPDPRLDDYVLGSLNTWKFRPARLDGETVAVKVLMGIPMWLPDGK